MRLAVRNHCLETGGEIEAFDLAIKPTAEAFRAMIDGLYSDKIGSIVRELLANAYDAHVAVGNPEPFFVHAPKFEEPEFFVRDYGIGMDHAKVRQTYATLFDSDKRHTNALMGTYGLGSKSPFSYTDLFTVACYDGRTVRLYAVSIGEGGIPRIVLQSEEPCDEPQGVRVGFAVDPADFSKFENAINYVSLGYDRPFRYNLRFKRERGTPVLKGTGWTGYRDSGFTDTWTVRQGTAIYFLESKGGLILPADYARNYLIDVPIGTIDVTTSRENVAYTPRTVTYLEKRLDEIKNEATEIVRNELKDIENVRQYFDRAGLISPSFIKDDLAHPETKLLSPGAELDDGQFIIRAHFSTQKFSWEYSRPLRVEARSPKNCPKYTVYRITDVDTLASRPGHPFDLYNDTDSRRVTRLIRRFLSHWELSDGEFWLNVNWTDRFVSLLLPNVTLVDVSVAEMKATKPIPREKRIESKIRGVRISRLGERELGPVDKIESSNDRVWMTAQHYQRNGSEVINLARLLGFSEVYVAKACAYDLMKKSGIPSISDGMEQRLLAKAGMGLQEFANFAEFYTYHVDHHCQKLVDFGSKLYHGNHDAFETLINSCTEPGKFLDLLTPLIASKLIPFNYETPRALIHLAGREPSRSNAPNLSADMQELIALSETFFSASGLPSVQFLDDIGRASSAKQLKATTDALVAIFRALPLTFKWKD